MADRVHMAESSKGLSRVLMLNSADMLSSCHACFKCACVYLCKCKNIGHSLCTAGVILTSCELNECQHNALACQEAV